MTCTSTEAVASTTGLGTEAFRRSGRQKCVNL
jgi:hypothetical protein